jgi:TrmH family RNA methyltransferase
VGTQELITSTANPRIRAVRKLRERKERQASGTFLIEGLRIVGEALSQGAEIELLVTAPELLESAYGRQLVKDARQAGIPALEVNSEVFATISGKDGPQGLAAVIRQRWTQLDEITLEDGRDWVALDAVADPGNLGTILRTADAVGAAGVILLDQSTDPYDPTAVRASMGSIFSQKVVRATFTEFSKWKKRSGCFVAGTSGAASQDYHRVVYPRPLVLLMGSERQGLLDQHIQLCDLIVAIPMQGRSDSLNLAVATGIVLYEIYNQRRQVLEP